MLSVKRLGPAIITIAAVLFLAAVPNTKGDSGTALFQVEGFLDLLPAGACPTNCEFSGCSSTMHSNWEHAQGNDSGEIHSCAVSSKGCGDHSCAGGGTETDAAALDLLLERLEGNDIRDLDLRNEKFVLNPERRSIQIVACNGKVLISRNLSLRQLAQLGDF